VCRLHSLHAFKKILWSAGRRRDCGPEISGHRRVLVQAFTLQTRLPQVDFDDPFECFFTLRMPSLNFSSIYLPHNLFDISCSDFKVICHCEFGAGPSFFTAV